MSRNSEIGWTHHTANPWWGCAKVSPACDHCYANRFSDRLSESLFGERVVWGPGGHQVHKMTELERDAPTWDRAAAKAGERHRVFCGSMCDWAEGRADQRPSLARLFPLVDRTPNLSWLLLTKRPNIGARLLAEHWEKIPSNLWTGSTVENQEWADRRLPHLLSIDAPVRFVSVEPQLGPVDLRQHLGQGRGKINWVISGGESGAGARGWADMLTWYRSLRDQCAEAKVPFFFKQWGRFMQGEGDTLYKLRGKNPDNLLDGLRWEQYPDAIQEPTPGTQKRVPSRIDRLLEDRFEYLIA